MKANRYSRNRLRRALQCCLLVPSLLLSGALLAQDTLPQAAASHKGGHKPPCAPARLPGYTGIFGGGPMYKDASTTLAELQNSGYSEVVVWSVEVKPNGDLNFNGEFPLVSDGVYIGDQTHPDFAATLKALKQGTVKRITFSIGSSNIGDFQDIASLINAQGTGRDSVLYRNFKALKEAIPSLDAVDLDDENSFDASSTVAFSVMLGKLGYHVVPDPFDNMSYWQGVVSQINAQWPGTVDAVHLQTYAGGTGNNPCDWDFGGVPVLPGVWDQQQGTPAQVQSIVSGWKAQCGIKGGFFWLYDDVAGQNTAAQYAEAINQGVGAAATSR